MKPTNVDAFFSCSFREDDEDVVAFFRALAVGLDIRCRNVDRGSSATPPEEARELIKNSRLLIAVCTKRDKKEKGTFEMPAAVREEIAMAKALNKPLLIFAEKDVELDGFIHSYSTICTFERKDLNDPSFMEKAVSSIYQTMLRGITGQDVVIEQRGPTDFRVDFVRSLISLERAADSYLWHYSVRRRLLFHRPFTNEISIGAWASPMVKIPENAPNLEWNVNVDDGSREFSLKPSVKGVGPNYVEIGLKVEPYPNKDDWVEYGVIFKSPYLNPIFQADICYGQPNAVVHGIEFYCCDGQVAIARTDFIKVRFMFPAEYGLRPNDCVPVAGGISNKLDYLDEAETDRMRCEKELLGDVLFVTCEIERPYLNYVYGIAWNPPK